MTPDREKELSKNLSFSDRILEFYKRIQALQEFCFKCWAEQMSERWPRSVNSKIADYEMQRRGNPPHQCGKQEKIVLNEAFAKIRGEK